MRRMIVTGLVAMMMVALCAPSGAQDEAKPPLAAGTVLPLIETGTWFNTPQGNEVQFDEYPVVVVEFFSALQGNYAAMEQLNTLWETLGENHQLLIVGVTDASDKEAAAYIDRMNIRYPVVTNVGKLHQELENRYGITTYPATFIAARTARLTGKDDSPIDQAVKAGNRQIVYWSKSFVAERQAGVTAEEVMDQVEALREKHPDLNEDLARDKAFEAEALLKSGFYYTGFKTMQVAALFDTASGEGAKKRLELIKTDKELMTKIATDLKMRLLRRDWAKAQYFILHEQPERAIPLLKSIIEKHPDSEEARQAREELARLQK